MSIIELGSGTLGSTAAEAKPAVSVKPAITIMRIRTFIVHILRG